MQLKEKKKKKSEIKKYNVCCCNPTLPVLFNIKKNTCTQKKKKTKKCEHTHTYI